MLSVSVIIPAFQSTSTIQETLESVFAQTVPVHEIIVIDDGSTDGLNEAIQSYKSRIVFLKQENSGPAVARNNGINHASGDIIAFLDADDIWLPEKLALQLPLFEDPKVGVVFGNTFFLFENKLQGKTYFDLFRPFRGKVFLQLFEQNFVPMLSVLVRRQLVNSVGLFDESLRNVQDYDLLLRLVKICEFDYIQAPIAKYRISSKQISKNFVRAAELLLSVKERTYRTNLSILNGVNRHILERGLYKKYLRLALCYLRDGQQTAASRTLDNYYKARGVSFIYLMFRIILGLPEPVIRNIIKLWDKVHQKPELGIY